MPTAEGERTEWRCGTRRLSRSIPAGQKAKATTAPMKALALEDPAERGMAIEVTKPQAPTDKHATQHDRERRPGTRSSRSWTPSRRQVPENRLAGMPGHPPQSRASPVQGSRRERSSLHRIGSRPTHPGRSGWQQAGWPETPSRGRNRGEHHGEGGAPRSPAATVRREEDNEIEPTAATGCPGARGAGRPAGVRDRSGASGGGGACASGVQGGGPDGSGGSPRGRRPRGQNDRQRDEKREEACSHGVRGETCAGLPIAPVVEIIAAPAGPKQCPRCPHETAGPDRSCAGGSPDSSRAGPPR